MKKFKNRGTSEGLLYYIFPLNFFSFFDNEVQT